SRTRSSDASRRRSSARRSFLLRRRRRSPRQDRFAHAASDHADHFNPNVVPDDDVALSSGTSEQPEHQTADGGHLLIFERASNRLAPLREPPRPPDANPALTFSDDRRPAAALFDVADDLLEQVLHRHE